MSADQFLAEYWQQKPLLIRHAVLDFTDPLTADELAGLAMEECVESRLISTHGQTGACELSHGPFASDELQALGEQNWTLLVQAVDQWVEAVAALRNYCSFLPQWRMDDVMVSLATPGGGVGPHFDQYDVFLLQGQGSRLWRIGPHCDADTAQIDNGGVRNIEPFTPLEEHTLYSGDVLYIPPGVAHWGIAQTDCLTYSIGFRAPSHAEILSEWGHNVAATLSDQLRYTDPARSVPARSVLTKSASAQNHANGDSLIDSKVIDQLQHILQHYVDDRDALATWFGSWVTEPKYAEFIPESEVFTEQQLLAALRSHVYLQRTLATRVALSQLDAGWVLFVNGDVIPITASSLAFAQLISSEVAINTVELLPYCQQSDNCQLLTQLLTNGSYVLIDS